MSRDQQKAESTTTDVVCVGAGVAGLAAAREISASGLSVAVLEARDRIGGRIFTVRDDRAAVPIELGAEFVHGKPPETLAIVEAARLMLCDVPTRHWQARGGRLIPASESWAEFDAIIDGMKRAGDVDLSFKQYLDRYCRSASDHAKAAATMFIEGFHAARADKIGVKGLNRVNAAAGRIDGDNQFRILNGYDGIARWLQHQAARQGASFYLKTVVREVRWQKHRVEVKASSGRESRVYHARRVVITLPLGVLQAPPSSAGSVRFSPQLASKKKAARALAMGSVIKVVFRFREAFWERLELPSQGGLADLHDLGFLHGAGEQIPTWWTQLPVRTPILVGWTGGPAAEKLGKREEAYIIDRALGSLARVFNSSRSRLDELLEVSHLHDWSADRFARGAYSYVPVGGLAAQSELARPADDTLFFAGEATNTEGHIGTVHGAIASGLRAAREVIASIG